MIGQSIRSRMVFATMLPVLVMVLATAGAFWSWRVQDLEAAHQQRIRLLTHQVALFCANGLFSGNTASLQNVMDEMRREPGLRALYVFDTRGQPIANSGGDASRRYPALGGSSYVAEQRQLGVDVVSERIETAVLPLEDLFGGGQGLRPIGLGYTVLEFTRDGLEQRKRESMLIALAIVGVGLGLGGVLAIRLGNWVVYPVVRISQMINRIGKGDFSADVPFPAETPLRELQESLNQMARRLAWGREELESRVANVTRELREQMEQAQVATQAKSKFLASASHDLRQPAHALGMFVARLGQLPMDAQMRQLIAQMDASVQTMQDLLDSLLDLSRLDSGTLAVREGPVDLNALMQFVRISVETLALTKGLRLKVRNTRLWGISDQHLLQRIVVNLALNAVRYTMQGSVLIACRAHGADVRIEVWDSGIGIAPQHHEDIFREFYQLQSPAGGRSIGMGLGLHIVQRSAQLLGHRIEVRSEVGCGSRFTVVLRRGQQPAPALIGRESGVQSIGDFKGVRVLVIEDNEQALSAIDGLLQSWGCSVTAVTGLDAALHCVAAGLVPDVILSDFQLGGAGNGIQAIAQIRSRCARPIPACLVSGETQEELQRLAQQADLILLNKPLRPAKLKALLRRLLPNTA